MHIVGRILLTPRSNNAGSLPSLVRQPNIPKPCPRLNRVVKQRTGILFLCTLFHPMRIPFLLYGQSRPLIPVSPPARHVCIVCRD
jgi:hypothetical protein